MKTYTFGFESASDLSKVLSAWRTRAKISTRTSVGSFSSGDEMASSDSVACVPLSGNSKAVGDAMALAESRKVYAGNRKTRKVGMLW